MKPIIRKITNILDEINNKGLYKNERIITSDQNSEIRLLSRWFIWFLGKP